MGSDAGGGAARARVGERPVSDAGVPQQSLPVSVALHLLPGIALTVFIIVAAPMVRSWGMPVVAALFIGIPLVVVPIELGYLAWYARRSTGSWSPAGAVFYRSRLPLRRLALYSAGIVLWFLILVTASSVLVDEWLAETFFAWMPDAILQFSTVEDDDGTTSAAALGAVLLIAYVFNGVVGPLTEELYFRGHLLPRLSRYGGWAPVLNTVLFSLYHLWTPWQNPARIAGFLPLAWGVWRTRSVVLGIVSHVAINLIYLTLLVALLLSGT